MTAIVIWDRGFTGFSSVTRPLWLSCGGEHSQVVGHSLDEVLAWNPDYLNLWKGPDQSGLWDGPAETRGRQTVL
jgi:hypothetical protein